MQIIKIPDIVQISYPPLLSTIVKREPIVDISKGSVCVSTCSYNMGYEIMTPTNSKFLNFIIRAVGDPR